MIDIKAIRAAAEADTECPHEHYEVPMSEVQSSVLIAMCDAVERLRNAVKLTPDEYTALAHRTASKYTHCSDPTFTGYTFMPHTLDQFVDAVQSAVLAKLGATE